MTHQRHLRLVTAEEAAPMDPFVFNLLGSLGMALVGGAAAGIVAGVILRKIFGGRR